MDFLKKFGSRKFLAALAVIIVGIAMAFGSSEDTIRTVTGALTSVVSAIAYILAEAKVDAGKQAESGGNGEKPV